MPTAFPDVIAPIDALTVLAKPDIKVWMQAAVSTAVADVEQHIVNSHSLCVPRSISEREDDFRSWLEAFFVNGFDQWLDAYKHNSRKKSKAAFSPSSRNFSRGCGTRN